MYLLLNLQRKAAAALVLSSSVAACSAAALVKSGGEHRFLPALPGDQMQSYLAFNDSGGYLVTQDNSIDGNGLGIRARRYYSDLSASRWSFQVNAEGKGDQQNGRVAMLANGGAVFAWQGATLAGNRIFVRVIDANGIFVAPEISASADAVGHQSDPSIAVLTDQTAVVVWAEWNRDGNMQGVFGQRLSSTGARLGGVFQVNQLTALSQRSPSVLALANGNFVVAWVQELQGTERIDIYGRIYRPDGQPLGSAARLNDLNTICANPTLAPSPSGFRAAWSSRRTPGSTLTQVGINEFRTQAQPADLIGWDVVTRAFDFSGSPVDSSATINNVTRGDQFSPRLTAFSDKHLAVWTSYGQDGSDEGIFGRVVTPAGFDGDEFQVNSRTINKQIHPAAAGTGETVFVVWSSFMGGIESYDLFAQLYKLAPDETLPAPLAPFACGLSSTSICVTWPEFLTEDVDAYLVYVDGEETPEQSTGGMITITRANWLPGSTHTVRLAYRTRDGRVSPLSEALAVKTFGADANADGLPDDWQTENWGKRWPGAHEDSDHDGATNLEEFLAGTDPTDANSVLRMAISSREQGPYLEWNTTPGSYYQLQVTTDFKNWQNVGTPRFAASATDALPITIPGQVQYYRLIRMR